MYICTTKTHLNFLAFSHVNILRDGVGYDHSFEAGIVDPEAEQDKSLNINSPYKSAVIA